MTQKEALGLCPLFRDLSGSDLQNALVFFGAEEKSYSRGEILKDALSPLSAFGLVLDGTVAVTMTDIDGNEMLLAFVTVGQTFGESLCMLGENAPILISARSNVSVLWLRCENLRKPASTPLDHELHLRFADMLAKRTLRMNDRIQILSRMSIEEKLKAFFTECARDAGSASFTVPFDRAGMAAYLGVDRSALSRALSHLQESGAITFRKNQFTLHMQRTKGGEER